MRRMKFPLRSTRGRRQLSRWTCTRNDSASVTSLSTARESLQCKATVSYPRLGCEGANNATALLTEDFGAYPWVQTLGSECWGVPTWDTNVALSKGNMWSVEFSQNTVHQCPYVRGTGGLCSYVRGTCGLCFAKTPRTVVDECKYYCHRCTSTVLYVHTYGG